MGWCFYSHLVLRCTSMHQIKPIFSCLCLWSGAFTRILYFDVLTGTKTNLSLFVYIHGMGLLIATCTSMYKQAPKQTYLKLFMFTGWCFYSHLVLWCTNGHQNKHIFSCLSLWDGAFTRILYFDVPTGTKSNQFFSCLCLWGGAFSPIFYFDVQTGTKTNLFQFVYVHRMVLLLASCTLVHKRHQTKPNFSCLCLWGGAFTRILYFDVQTGTKSKLFLVVYVYEVVLFLAFCTSMYKQAPKQTYL